MYHSMTGSLNQVHWKTLFYGNLALARVIVNLWITCNERLETRDRLKIFVVIDSAKCNFCHADESQGHLLFDCRETAKIWRAVLRWIQEDHEPLPCTQEIDCVIKKTKWKSLSGILLNLAFTESVY